MTSNALKYRMDDRDGVVFKSYIQLHTYNEGQMADILSEFLPVSIGSDG